MKTYELSYIVSPEATSQEAEAKAKELELAIQSREGAILKQFNPVAKTFAFPIGKRASGFFGVLEFKIEPERLLEIKEIVERSSGSPGKILRHMIIINEPSRIRKIRRSRAAVSESIEVETEQKVEQKSEKPEVAVSELEIEKNSTSEPVAAKEKAKVELKDIEQQLDEILG